jgi:hypothetical protein
MIPFRDEESAFLRRGFPPVRVVAVWLFRQRHPEAALATILGSSGRKEHLKLHPEAAPQERNQ